MKITTVTLIFVLQGINSCGNGVTLVHKQKFESVVDCEVVLEQVVRLKNLDTAKCEVDYGY